MITLKNEKLSQIVWQWVGRLPSDGFIYGDLSLLNNKDGNYTFIYPDLKTGLQVRIKLSRSEDGITGSYYPDLKTGLQVRIKGKI